jgi:hypothetical protein
MRSTLIAIVVLFSCVLNAEECKGHIFFYVFDEAGDEAYADFSYYYQKSVSWLKKGGVSTSIHSKSPIKTDTCFSSEVIVPTELLKLSLGYVFMKPNEEIKVIGGVMTGVDLSDEVNEYFK